MGKVASGWRVTAGVRGNTEVGSDKEWLISEAHITESSDAIAVASFSISMSETHSPALLFKRDWSALSSTVISPTAKASIVFHTTF